MSVPKEHVTVRLESLPKGLRAKAEKLIKKKFGLAPDPFPKGIQKSLNDINNRMMDNMAMGMDVGMGMSRVVEQTADSRHLENSFLSISLLDRDNLLSVWDKVRRSECQ